MLHPSDDTDYHSVCWTLTSIGKNACEFSGETLGLFFDSILPQIWFGQESTNIWNKDKIRYLRLLFASLRHARFREEPPYWESALCAKWIQKTDSVLHNSEFAIPVLPKGTTGILSVGRMQPDSGNKSLLALQMCHATLTGVEGARVMHGVADALK